MDDRKRKWIYWSTVLGSSALIVGLVYFGLGLLGSLCHVNPSHLRDHAAGVPGLSLALSGFVAARLLRRLGLSRAGHRTEMLTRGDANPPETPRERAAVASAHPWALSLAGCFTGGLALSAAGLSLLAIPPLWIPAILLGIVSAVFWRGCFTDSRFACVADQDGVATNSLVLGASSRIQWSQIGECRIEARQDAIGRHLSTVCTLFDHSGTQLLRLDLGAVDAKERAAFLDAVRARLCVSGRAELIAAEAPAGLGTELEAAEVPAGRGTEPEASGVPDGRGTELDAASAAVPANQEPAQPAAPPGHERARDG